MLGAQAVHERAKTRGSHENDLIRARLAGGCCDVVVEGTGITRTDTQPEAPRVLPISRATHRATLLAG